MKDIYLISTFRHAWNREFNPRIAAALQSRGFRCYCAHRDTDQTLSPREIFARDMFGLMGARIVLAIAENESPNWGAEVGLAYGRRMPVIALAKRDHQIPLILNGMVSECVRVDDLNLIEGYLDELDRGLRRRLGESVHAESRSL